MYDKYNMVVKELKGIFNELEIPLDDSLTDLPQHRWDKSLNIEYLLFKFMDDTENIESIHHADLVRTCKLFRREIYRLI